MVVTCRKCARTKNERTVALYEVEALRPWKRGKE